MSEDAKVRAKARQKALADLGRKHRTEYQALYRSHLKELGLGVQTPSVPPKAPVEVDGKQPCLCDHTRRFHSNSGCRVCGCKEFRARRS